MNSEIKVVVTISGIPGRTRHFVGKQKIKNVINFVDKKKNKIIEKEIYYKIPKYVYASTSKRINLCREFFDYATSKECPNWFSNYGVRKDMVRKWEKMSWKERLEAHLLRIALDNKGSSFSYNVLED